jgi:hypothetical protein
MRFSARSKVGIILSILTILTVVSGFMVMALSNRGTATHAAAYSKTYHHGAIHQRQASIHARPKVSGAHMTRAQSFHSKAAKHLPSLGGVPAKGVSPKALKAKGAAPAVAGGLAVLKPHVAEGGQLQNFEGISDLSSDAANGFAVTPPDQGLCTGIDGTVAGDPQTVFEIVNLEVRETDVTGTTLFGDASLASFFFDPNFLSDPRCIYDSKDQTFFFTVLSTDFATFSAVDVVVINENGFANYSAFLGNAFPADGGCGCLGDQPLLGQDNHFVFFSTNEFAFFGGGGFDGALVTAVSKADLVAETGAFFTEFPLIATVNGVPALSIQPADSVSSTKTEYFLESFPFDQFGNPNPIDKTVALWSAPGDDIDTLTLNLVSLIGTERYGFPVDAASTGSGLTDGSGITSEAFLNPDDSRMQQVEAIKDTNTGHIDLWASLSTSVAFKGDPVTYDGAAWFKFDAKKASVLSQGYVASQGNFLLYPAIDHTFEGSTTMVFTVTSPSIDPSAAYTTRKSGSKSFGSIVIAAQGFDAHESFSDFFFGQARWGDYSAAALDPNGKDVWMATEYIPSQINQDALDNWGTRVFDVKGDH